MTRFLTCIHSWYTRVYQDACMHKSVPFFNIKPDHIILCNFLNNQSISIIFEVLKSYGFALSKTFKTGDFFRIWWICWVVWISCKNFEDFSKLLNANVRTLESLNTYLSIPRVLSLNSVKKFLEPILLPGKWKYDSIYV